MPSSSFRRVTKIYSPLSHILNNAHWFNLTNTGCLKRILGVIGLGALTYSGDLLADTCNWHGTRYALCTHITDGWGWQNGVDCVGRNTCATLTPPNGVINSSSSSADATSCNWWGTQFPLCTHIDVGWGNQNGADCVGRNSCETLPPPYGIVEADTPTDDPIDSGVLFDDFSYSNRSEMQGNNWSIRSGGGGPGVSGATWSPDYVTFVPENNNGNSLMRMRASSQGVNGPNIHSEVTHNKKHIKGTYATRMRFSNTPVSGPDGDQINETFYTITSLNYPMDPLYSEMDFEYLGNGGWGQSSPTMFMTTWETYQADPWIADNIHNAEVTDHSGWHTLVIQVDDDTVRYYVDGHLRASHSGKYYPETAMSINFNLWFINGGLISSSAERVYQQDIDWLYFIDSRLLSTVEVENQVRLMREQGVGFTDTTP
ncbi:hypothetical protein BTA51_22770 [Hahella sp. CCB-MM4]|uniref:family 16 glycosylhydrolase n=1 Tax=Hahella sp. (strain CCB-MM4) TaxID=1926491 RepID=UPI000BC4235F|nr:family 16 glycosylhydrolase [Hahella sp. CCB-MM4]OZG71194.1 hypothetical protein BTA51_22770 [Hahella sp. CCB-MM4]